MIPGAYTYYSTILLTSLAWSKIYEDKLLINN